MSSGIIISGPVHHHRLNRNGHATQLTHSNADKSKCRCRIKNVYSDNWGFPDQSEEFDVLLHDIDGGPILRKLKHPPPPLGVVNPLFLFPFDELIHGVRLCKDLDLS